MNTSPESSCFDCPLVCEIGNQLKRSYAVRDEVVAESIHVMSEFEAIEGTGVDDTVIRSRWQNTSEEIFSLLDSADKSLADSRVALLETCEAHQPIRIDAQAGSKESASRCSSALAERVMRALDIKNE